MAGSRKWFVYTDDTGTTFGVNLDESNTEAVNGNALGYPATGGPTQTLPRGIKPREVFYSNPTRTRTIRCVALTQALYATAISSGAGTIPDPIAGSGTLSVSRSNGERRTKPTPIDTGLDDGDQP